MNTHLDKALDTHAQICAILDAIDEIYMENEESKFQNLFYIVEDLAQKLGEELDMLAQDRKVVNAIYAANDVSRISTLKIEE